MRDFDQQLLMSADESIELRVEAAHRHSLVTEVVGEVPERARFRGHRVVLLYPERSLVPFGVRCASLDDWTALPHAVGASLRLLGRTLSVPGGAALSLEGPGVDLRVHPMAARCLPALRRERLAWLQPDPDAAAREGDPLSRALEARLLAFVGRLQSGALGAGDGSLIRPLVGLGLGSTPSGDDLLTGALAMLWTQDSARCTAAREAIAGEIAALTKDRTTVTSLEMLWHAARGDFPEALGAFVRALEAVELERRAFGALEAALLRLGATSGRDMRQGVVAIARWLDRPGAKAP